VAANTIYITAGLPVAKNADQNPEGINTVYITAGLPPQPLESEETTTTTNPFSSFIISSKIFNASFIR